MKFLYFVMVCFLWPSCAMAQGCMKAPETVIKIERVRALPTYDYSYNLRQINNMNPARVSDGITLGVTASMTDIASQIRMSSRKLPNGRFCSYLSEVNFRLGYPLVKIYVASEFAPGTCGHSHILEHENRHVHAIDEVLNLNWLSTTSQMNSYVEGLETIETFSQEEAYKMYKDEIQKYMNLLAKRMDVIMRNRQGQIDTAAEYARNRAACRGEISLVIRRAYGK